MSIKNNSFLIEITIENLEKVHLEILSNIENHSSFILKYDIDNISLPYSIIIKKLLKNIYLLIDKFKIKIYFQGIPSCIFEKLILRPGLRSKYDKNIFILKGEINDFIDSCLKCDLKKKCSGIQMKYLKKFGNEEFKSIYLNNSLYDVNKKKVSKFQNGEIKNLGLEILDDFKQDKYYLRKRFVFVNSFPNTLDESSKERFVYYIYNREDDFEENYNLLKNYFSNQILEDLKYYLIKSSQLVISFAIMANNKLRKTLYFNMDSLNETEIEILSNKLNISFKKDCLIWGVGIDFKENDISYKVYYEEKQITKKKLLDYVKEFENNSKFEKLINFIQNNVNNVLLDEKFKNNNLYSKRIDISLQYNDFNLQELFSLLEINFDKSLDYYTLSFEFIKNSIEKINLYYSLLNK